MKSMNVNYVKYIRSARHVVRLTVQNLYNGTERYGAELLRLTFRNAANGTEPNGTIHIEINNNYEK